MLKKHTYFARFSGPNHFRVVIIGTSPGKLNKFSNFFVRSNQFIRHQSFPIKKWIR